MAHKGVQLLGPELLYVTLYQSYGNFSRPAAAAFVSRRKEKFLKLRYVNE